MKQPWRIAATLLALTACACAQSMDILKHRPLRQLRISRNGEYALAQDDYEIVDLTLPPFRIAFRIPARHANLAQFTPDSTQIVFIGSVDQMSQESLRRPGSEARRSAGTSPRVDVWSRPRSRS